MPRLKVTREAVEYSLRKPSVVAPVRGLDGALGTDITVRPANHWCRRWIWKVELTRGAVRNPSCFSMGGTFRRPAPDTVQGRARTEDQAWQRARECTADVARQIARHHHAISRTSTDKVPL